MSGTRDNSGALFRNKDKTKDTQPDYSGPAMFRGEAIRLAGWLATAKDGSPYLSLKLEPKDEQRPAAPKPGATPDDEIPF